MAACANVSVCPMKSLAVNRNNCKVTLVSRKKVFVLRSTLTDSQTRFVVLKVLTLLDDGHASYLAFLTCGFFVYKTKRIIVTISELFGKDRSAAPRE